MAQMLALALQIIQINQLEAWSGKAYNSTLRKREENAILWFRQEKARQTLKMMTA